MFIFLGCPQESKEYKFQINGEESSMVELTDSTYMINYEIKGSYFVVNKVIFSDFHFKVKNIGLQSKELYLAETDFDVENYNSNQISDSIKLILQPNEEQEINLSFRNEEFINKINTDLPQKGNLLFSWKFPYSTITMEKFLVLFTD